MKLIASLLLCALALAAQTPACYPPSIPSSGYCVWPETLLSPRDRDYLHAMRNYIAVTDAANRKHSDFDLRRHLERARRVVWLMERGLSYADTYRVIFNQY